MKTIARDYRGNNMKFYIRRWLTLRSIFYLKYIPVIIHNIKNWPTFLINYLRINKKGGTYIFQNGIRISDEEGTAPGTIAVVFIRKHYGSVKGKSVIVDIGANIGVFSVYAASEEKNATVYSFEPIRENYELLLKNISNNNFTDRIKAFNFGVASRTHEREFNLITSPSHSFMEKERSGHCVNVHCLSLKDILSSNNISKVDLLKVNCEGAEYEIFYSTPLECFKKINDIRMEYHNLDSYKKNMDYLKKFLKNKGYKTTHLWINSKEDGFLWMRRIN